MPPILHSPTMVRWIRARWLVPAALLVVAGAVECPADDPQTPLDPRAAQPVGGADLPPNAAASAENPADPAESTAPPPTTAASATSFLPIDAMVGQVNGQAIYASTVFEAIEDVLLDLGGRRPRLLFRREAEQLVTSRLKGIVLDALILGEAMRDLEDPERLALRQIMQKNREQLLRRFGQGSPALADATLLNEKGTTLDQTLKDIRRVIVVRRYIDQKVLATVNVSRGDIRRYYRDHADQYKPGSTRTLRRIQVLGEEEAQQVLRTLEQGTGFAEVASGPPNQYRRLEGGLMSPVPGEAPLREEELNRALGTLQEGDYFGPIAIEGTYWFVYLEKLDRPEGTRLIDAQIEIGEKLTNERERQQQEQFRQRLRREGSFTDEQKMAEVLLGIAMNRYAPPIR